MSKVEMSVEEIVAYIKRSSVFNVVVEGRDDVVAYRYLESGADAELERAISIVPTGGRNKVLEVFMSLAGHPSMARCAFVCDQDSYAFVGIPVHYVDPRLHFTAGYSLENDLILDCDPSLLMRPHELVSFQADLSRFTRWFSFAMADALNGGASAPSTHVNVVLSGVEAPHVATALQADPRCITLYASISASPKRLLRGKSLLALYVRYLSNSSRTPKHSALSLIEHGAAANGQNFSRIRNLVRNCFVS